MKKSKKQPLRVVYQSEGEMSTTPAAVDRESGILYINPKRWFKLTSFQQKYVKLHEKGHYYLDTEDELKADEYAFNHLAGTEFRSLKQCIECLETLLDSNKIGHKVRIEHMYELARRWDAAHPIKTTGNDVKQTYAIGAILAEILAQSGANTTASNSALNANSDNTKLLIAAVAMMVLVYFVMKN